MGGVVDESAADLAAFGAPSEMIAAASAKATQFDVWQENAETLVMFLRLQTQWNVIAGGFLGLNYQSVEFLLKMHAVADPVGMLEELQAMEVAALQVLNKRKE